MSSLSSLNRPRALTRTNCTRGRIGWAVRKSGARKSALRLISDVPNAFQSVRPRSRQHRLLQCESELAQFVVKTGNLCYNLSRPQIRPAALSARGRKREDMSSEMRGRPDVLHRV